MNSNRNKPESGSGSPRFGWALATLVFCALGVQPALAVHDVGLNNLELDGNTANGGREDWNDVHADTTALALRTSFVTDSAASDPTAFTGGVKDTLPLSSWTCTTSTVQDKSNILHAYGATYSDAGDVILYAGADREGVNGTANFGIWLFQNKVSCVSAGGITPFTGTHLHGDLLLVAEFDNGGRVTSIKVYKWKDPNGIPQDGDECLGGASDTCGDAGTAAFTGLNCSTSPANDSVCGITNDAGSINASWRAGIAANGFYEAGVNLSELIEEELGCFATAVVTTRSSTSLTATLKDFVALDLSTCATITVEKQTEGGNGTFGFTLPDAGPPGSPFNLQDNGVAEFATVEPGNYTLTEAVMPAGPAHPDGWHLTDISCTGGTLGDPVYNGDEGSTGGSIDITVDLNDDVECVFTNTFTAPPGAITIEKSCVAANQAQEFDFDLLGDGFASSTTADCQDGEETLACGESITCEGLAAGDYMVVEDAVVGWATEESCQASGEGTDCSTDPATVDIILAEDGAVTATFTNTELASVTIEKMVVGGGGPPFEFEGDISGTISHGESFSAFDIPPGTLIETTEIVTFGYSLESINCTGTSWTSEDETVSVTPTAGEHVVCTFTNVENPGFIEVCKEVRAIELFAVAFEIHLDGPDGDLPTSSSLAHDECDFGEIPLSAGSGYSVSEEEPFGFTPLISCSGGEDPANIDLSPGEFVTCTVLNQEFRPIPVDSRWAMIALLALLAASGLWFRRKMANPA